MAEDTTNDQDVAVAAPVLLTVANLGIAEGGDASAVAQASWVQYVEPTRNGVPWCDWPDAEDMLVRAAHRTTAGMAGAKYMAYRLTRDDGAMTLTLEMI